MSNITNLIFKNKKHYVTSNFGYRKVTNVNGSYTNSFHNGTDYGTNKIKLAQYAIENGTIISCGTDKLGGKFVWIKYPRINVKMLHYHLSSINCKTGQRVSKGTLIGYTGMSGVATGIHLHLSIVDLSNGKYIDPETYKYDSSISNSSNNDFFPSKGYFSLGDTHKNIGKIAKFMYKNFSSYTKKAALGNYYGKYIKSSITEFQKRTNLEKDGKVGPITLSKLKEYGFKE